MKRSLTVIISGIAIMISLSVPSCQNNNDPSGKESGEAGSITEGLSSEKPEEIIITREQFESSGMKLGDPLPMMFRKIVSANGYIVSSPAGHAKISTMIPGRVKQINFTAGDFVNKGQLLFTIESNEIILLQQEYAETFNQLKALKAQYERQKALSEKQITAQKDFIDAESNYMSLVSKTEGLKKRLEMIHIEPTEVEKGIIKPVAPVYSPMNGYITKQNLVVGEFIEPQATVMELIDPDQMRLNIHVFEKDLKEMVTGQQVLYYDPDDQAQKYEASLSHIGKSIDQETRTVLCIAQLKPSDRKIFVNNLYVQTEIITCQREAPAVPNQALIKEDDWHFVLQLADEKNGDLIFHKIPVHPGVTMPEHTEILDKGLTDILVQGGYNLVTEE